MGWPTLDQRLRLEPTASFSIICHATDGHFLLTQSKVVKGILRSNDKHHKSNDTTKKTKHEQRLSVTFAEDYSALHSDFPREKENIAADALAEAQAETEALLSKAAPPAGDGVSPPSTAEGDGNARKDPGVVCIEVICPYTRSLVAKGFARRHHAWRVTADKSEATLHWADYELIDWTRVVAGNLRASSYCVRKGLSRKAQLSRYCNKYMSKRPETLLKTALPRTLVIDTWEAFDEDMTFNLGGDIASFGRDMGVRQSVSLATRLDWCLAEAQEWVEGRMEEDEEKDQRKRLDQYQEEQGVRRQQPRSNRRRPRWILKPSTLNKGAGLTVGEGFDLLREAVHASPDIREWVLQEYIDRPLLVEGRKFHLRAYALAVGCLQVYLFDQVLLLRAARDYPTEDDDGSSSRMNGSPSGDKTARKSDDAVAPSGFGADPLAHITNTARQAEDSSFQEVDNVWLLEDLVRELHRQGLSEEVARLKVERLAVEMRALTAELFRAFRGEFTVFSPLPDCFEHFGLDFMVDQDFRVWLLEANPGPDFKQTGGRLKHVIGSLMEDTMRICLDPKTVENGHDRENSRTSSADAVLETGFTLVLDEKWRGTSAAPSMKMV